MKRKFFRGNLWSSQNCRNRSYFLTTTQFHASDGAKPNRSSARKETLGFEFTHVHTARNHGLLICLLNLTTTLFNITTAVLLLLIVVTVISITILREVSAARTSDGGFSLLSIDLNKVGRQHQDDVALTSNDAMGLYHCAWIRRDLTFYFVREERLFIMVNGVRVSENLGAQKTR